MAEQFLSLETDFSNEIKREIKDLELKLGRVFAGIVESSFVRLVLDTPQYSGRMAASWNLTVNRASGRVASESEFPFPKDNPYQKGDMPAVMTALSFAQGKASTFKDRFEAHGWTMQVNNAIPYASEVNDGSIKLRSEVGHSPGFVDWFLLRVNAIVVTADSDWEYYANTDFLGGIVT